MASRRGEPVVDHFVPWARYPLDLGHNFVLADEEASLEAAHTLSQIRDVALC